MRKIGILEDDEALGKELTYYLSTNGYEVRFFSPKEYEHMKTEQLLQLLIDAKLHLLLLDIGLPGQDGLHLCKQFRRQSEVPIIMITSKNNELTELISIESGADDFVAKPFQPQILVAHMESVMRRVYKDNAGADTLHLIQTRPDGERQEFTIDYRKGRVQNGTGQTELSKNEMLMLKILSSHQGEIVSRDDIINELWDDCMFVDDNTLTVNMTRLKTKLSDIGITDAIQTKRGMGYRLL